MKRKHSITREVVNPCEGCDHSERKHRNMRAAGKRMMCEERGCKCKEFKPKIRLL